MKMVLVSQSKVKILLGAFCIATFAVGCSKGSDQPAPAPAPAQPQAERKAEPKPEKKDQLAAPQAQPKKEEPKSSEPKVQTPAQPVKPQPQAQPAKPEQPAKPAESKPQSAKPAEVKPQPQLKSEEKTPVVPPAKSAQPAKQDPQAARLAEQIKIQPIPEQLEKASQELGFTVINSPKLQPYEVERGLALLKDAVAKVRENYAKAAKQDGQAVRIEPVFDTIILDRKNERIKESHEKFHGRFDVNQSVVSAAQSLTFEYVSCDGETTDADRFANCKSHFRSNAYAAFSKAKAELDQLRAQIGPIQCGEHNKLSVEKCVLGARVVKALQIPEQVKKSFKQVIVVDHLIENTVYQSYISTDEKGDQRLVVSYVARPATVVDDIKHQLEQGPVQPSPAMQVFAEFLASLPPLPELPSLPRFQ